MLILNLTSVGRGPVRIREQVSPQAPVWEEVGLELQEPLRVDLEAREVGEGVLVRGEMETELAAECRRCLGRVPVAVRDTVDLLYEPLSGAEEAELGGEVYALPERGDELDLLPALREQLLLRVPDYVVCAETCRGFCPQCGADLNRTDCACVRASHGGPWEALRDIKFD
jgi:uncharacterized protein